MNTFASCGAARTEVSALREAAARESSPVVRASIVAAVGADDSAWLSDPDPAVRVISSVLRGAETQKERDILRADVPPALETLASLPWITGRGEPMRFILDSLGDQPDFERGLLETWMKDADPAVREAAVFASERLMQSSLALRCWRSVI